METTQSTFIGLFLRAKNIRRWPLMDGREELLSTHIFEASVIAHLLGAIAADVYGEKVNPDRVAALAITHEASEVAGAGDIPSPVKYRSQAIATMFKQLESEFEDSLLETLPDVLKPRYAPLIKQDKSDPEVRLAKSADVICAYLKCEYELSKSNHEFNDAMGQMKTLLAKHASESPAVQYFIDTFMANANATLDEQAKNLDWVMHAVEQHKIDQ